MVDSRLVQPSPFTWQLDARLTQVEEMSDIAEPVQTSDVFAFEV